MSLAADAVRSGVGLALGAVPLLTLTVPRPVQFLLTGLIFLFAGFAWQTLRRFNNRITVEDHGLTVHGFRHRHALSWKNLTAVRLRFFPTNRRRSDGWFQLTLEDPQRRLDFESALDGFPDLVKRALQAAATRHLSLSSVTLDNAILLGVPLPAALRPADTAPGSWDLSALTGKIAQDQLPVDD